jgi:hypothetical protein
MVKEFLAILALPGQVPEMPSTSRVKHRRNGLTQQEEQDGPAGPFCIAARMPPQESQERQTLFALAILLGRQPDAGKFRRELARFL